MDKDSIILKYEQEEMKDVQKDICELIKRNDEQAKQLDGMQEKIKNVYTVIGQKPFEPKKKSFNVIENVSEGKIIVPISSYHDLYKKARVSLIDRGLDVDNLNYHDLVSESELREIERELNKF